MTQPVQFKSRTNTILKAFLFCIVFTGLFIALSSLKAFIPGTFERWAHGIIGTIAAFLVTFLFLKIDKKSFTSIGLTLDRFTVVKFFLGILLGIGLMGLLSVSVIYFSELSWEVNPKSSILNFLFMTLPLIPLAFMEETAFRAYPLVIIKDEMGSRNAIIITSIFFALYHTANGWTIQNAFLGAGTWGIIYGLAAVYSNGISMPTGIHYAANLTTAAFGISDSSYNLWILKQANGSTLENYQSNLQQILITQLSLLVLGIIFMELYLRRKKIN